MALSREEHEFLRARVREEGHAREDTRVLFLVRFVLLSRARLQLALYFTPAPTLTGFRVSIVARELKQVDLSRFLLIFFLGRLWAVKQEGFVNSLDLSSPKHIPQGKYSVLIENVMKVARATLLSLSTDREYRQERMIYHPLLVPINWHFIDYFKLTSISHDIAS